MAHKVETCPGLTQPTYIQADLPRSVHISCRLGICTAHIHTAYYAHSLSLKAYHHIAFWGVPVRDSPLTHTTGGVPRHVLCPRTHTGGSECHAPNTVTPWKGVKLSQHLHQQYTTQDMNTYLWEHLPLGGREG